MENFHFSIALVFAFIFAVQCSSAVEHRIKKRDAVQLGHMIQCTHGFKKTWYPIWAILRFSDYGCYCGFGGSGTPIDESDNCCQEHDLCYNRVELLNGLSSYTTYLTSYKYKCSRGNVQCRDKSGWKRSLCTCDKELALCLATNRRSYKSKYRNIDVERKC